MIEPGEWTPATRASPSLEAEVAELLGKAKSHWQEYQRLKAARSRGNKAE